MAGKKHTTGKRPLRKNEVYRDAQAKTNAHRRPCRKKK